MAYLPLPLQSPCLCTGRLQGLKSHFRLRGQQGALTYTRGLPLQILVMRNGRMESKAETEASPLPGLWPLLPITASCETTVVPDVDSDSR